MKKLTSEEVEELKRDFENLLDSYWYVNNTRMCTPFPQEIEANNNYAKELMKRYGITS